MNLAHSQIQMFFHPEGIVAKKKLSAMQGQCSYRYELF